MYEESGSENKNVEEDEKGENEKNTKDSTHTNIGSYKIGKQAGQWKIENPRIITKSQEIKNKLEISCHQRNDPFQSGTEHFYK